MPADFIRQQDELIASAASGLCWHHRKLVFNSSWLRTNDQLAGSEWKADRQ